jgi:hypothetical protein
VFWIIVPLDDGYSFDYGVNHNEVPDTIKDSADKVSITKMNRYTERKIKILRYVAKHGKITTKETETIKSTVYVMGENE